jgi:NhaC family Na+:H+ antiporter
VFVFLGLGFEASGDVNTTELLSSIETTFHISGWLFLVPLVIIVLIVKKTPPIVALLIGSLLGGLFAVLFQPQLVAQIGGGTSLTLETAYKGIMNALTVDTQITTNNDILNELFTSGGMRGMLGTIWLIICAMVFGGVMEAIGALSRISSSLLQLANSTFSLFASTVASCLAVNLTASDQYLSIVIPGKMFHKAFEEKKLAPENLSRTLEDAGTVTSVLIPWNTCGAYQSGVLGVSVADYFMYAIFNWISPFMTLLYAALHIKIKQLTK